MNRYPFLEYASLHVLYYADIAAKRFPQDDFLSSFPLSNWGIIRNTFEKLKIRRYTQDASLIYILADNGHSELVRILPKEERQRHIPTERYKYPLFAAIVNGSKETVAAILDLPSTIYGGIDFMEGLNNRKVFKNRTPLSWAAQEGRDTLVQLLLHNGVVIDQIDQAGHTALSRASQNGHEATIKLLIENGADVNASDNGGWTPLLQASWKGHEAVARLLIENGADVNASDNEGWIPLLEASWKGHQVVAKLLIENGADPNARNNYGSTPLLEALSKGRQVVAMLLVENGADPNAGNNYGSTPLL